MAWPVGVGASGVRVCSLCVGFMSDWHAKKLRFYMAFLALEMIVLLGPGEGSKLNLD